VLDKTANIGRGHFGDRGSDWRASLEDRVATRRWPSAFPRRCRPTVITLAQIFKLSGP
jgi:hypothetical protein